MTLQFMIWGLLALAMATGLVAGVFLTFSDFVMKSLRAAQPAAGTEAMQIINRYVFRSLFMVLLVGLIPVSALMVVFAYVFLDGGLATCLITGGLLYFFGVFLVSMVGNVPMNQTLEALPQGGAAAQTYWPKYVKGWVLWNHIRWITALGASTCYAVGAILMAQAA